MPELPEVETTRRGIAPHAVGRTIAAVEVHDGRLRWPVPGSLPETLTGRTLTRLERRSKYLLFRCERAGVEQASDHAGTLLVHLGMTGSLRWYSAATAGTPRRTHDHVDIRFDERYGAALSRPAALWRDPVGRGPGRETSPAGRTGSGAIRPGVERRDAAPVAAHAIGGDQAGADGQPCRRRRRQHLRQRSAVPRGDTPRPRRQPGQPAPAGTLGRRSALDADGSHRQGRQHAAGLCRQQRRTGLFPAGLLRVRPGRTALPAVRDAPQGDPAGRACNELLPPNCQK